MSSLQRRVVHLKRPNTNLAYCGEDGPFFVKTFDVAEVTCVKCRQRGALKVNAPQPIKRTVGRVVQPGGGHRR